MAPPPWQVNAVSDNVVYTLVMGVPLDDSVGQFPFLSALLAGAASSGGQAHLRFPSDTFPLCRADSRFVIRAREEEESEPVRARLLGGKFRQYRSFWGWLGRTRVSRLGVAVYLAGWAFTRSRCRGVSGWN